MCGMKLIQAACHALAENNARVAIFTLDGERHVAKAPGDGRGWAQALLLKAFCRLAFGCSVPLASLRLVNGQARLEHEATRLRHLAAAGESVPRVRVVEPGCMVLEYVGNTVEQSLQAVPHAQYADFLAPALEDLVRFHAAGHWHGGAQIKNLTLLDNRLYRIDFEEDLGAYLPLPLMQAFDLVLFVNSCTLLCGMGETASVELATALFRRYLQAPPDAAVRAILLRGLRALSVVCALLSPLRNRRGRSLKRIFILRDALSVVLAA